MDPLPGLLERLFQQVVAARSVILLACAVLVVPAAYVAGRIPRDDAIERMASDADPDLEATRAFQAVFPERPAVLLLAESSDPLAEPAVSALRDLQAAVAQAPDVRVFSVLDVAQEVRPDLLAAGRRAELRAFLDGTRFFRSQGLRGDRFLGLAVVLGAADPAARGLSLEAIEAAAGRHSSRFERIRLVGEPFVSRWLERETASASRLTFPLFGLFVTGVSLALYRSPRSVAALLLTLGACVLAATALGGLMDFRHSIISPLMALTVMATAASSLVYLHSRFAARLPGAELEAHRVAALADKFPPVSASIFAAAVGFAALGVSRIRPVHELGLWCAAGLAACWLLCFTLFPALQKVLGAPSRESSRGGSPFFERAARALPEWSFRRRRVLLAATGALCAAGTLALFGWPGWITPMPLETDGLDYLPRGSALVQDARFFEKEVAGLQGFALWVQGRPGTILEPEALAGLANFAAALGREPEVGSVLGLTSILGLRRYATGQDEAWPADAAGRRRLAEEAEQLLLGRDALRGWVDMETLGQTRFQVLPAAGRRLDPDGLRVVAQRLWVEVLQAHPALEGSAVRLVGQALLERQIARHLVPTLVESFLLTAVLIFVAFLLLFRSGALRLLAMIPSLVALLGMFLVMRLLGVPLNVATLLIATTVLGATENDQVHFFWHFQEARRRGAGTEAALGRALSVAGRAIVFATLVNAIGFLALALSDVPPVRQFGLLTAAAFACAMVADFTALPAALWALSGERPEPRRAPLEEAPPAAVAP